MGGEDEGQVEREAGDEGALDLLQFLSVPHDGCRLLGEPGQHVVSHWGLQENDAASMPLCYSMNTSPPVSGSVWIVFP